MEKLQTISHPKFGTLSIIMIDGREMFKAKECAVMLGYVNVNDAISRHCKGVVKHDLPTKGGKQEVSLIPEGDVWRLIIRSKLPQAEEIEKWIMEEVLPSIRKTGSYTMKQPEPKQLEIYEYFDKTYNSEPVLSTADIAELFGISRATADWVVRTKLTEKTDYYFLNDNELTIFKKENPKISSLVSNMYVITKSGFDMFCKIYNADVKTPGLFLEEKKDGENDESEYPMQFVTPALKKKMESIRENAERLIHLTYLLDTSPGRIICGKQYHSFTAEIICQIKKLSYVKL